MKRAERKENEDQKETNSSLSRGRRIEKSRDEAQESDSTEKDENRGRSIGRDSRSITGVRPGEEVDMDVAISWVLAHAQMGASIVLGILLVISEIMALVSGKGVDGKVGILDGIIKYLKGLGVQPPQ